MITHQFNGQFLNFLRMHFLILLPQFSGLTPSTKQQSYKGQLEYLTAKQTDTSSRRLSKSGLQFRVNSGLKSSGGQEA